MANILKAWEVSLSDTGLFVRARVSDVSTGSAVFVANVVMTEDETYTYFGTLSVDPNKTYLVQPRVYTDGTFSTVDSSQPIASKILDSGSGSGSTGGVEFETATMVATEDEVSVMEAFEFETNIMQGEDT